VGNVNSARFRNRVMRNELRSSQSYDCESVIQHEVTSVSSIHHYFIHSNLPVSIAKSFGSDEIGKSLVEIEGQPYPYILDRVYSFMSVCILIKI
jgi:hypothetical protein